MRPSRLLFAVACLALLVAAPASAAVRYASPSGSVSPTCNPTPCSLATAVGGASPGDQVSLAAGTYKVTALSIDKAIEVGGAPGASTTIEFSNGEGAEVKNAGAVLHDVRVAFTSGTETMDSALELRSGTVERAYVDSSRGGSCLMWQGLIRDSVCFGGLDVSPYENGSYQANVTNVTADPLLIAASGGANLAVEAVNTLALPHPQGGGSQTGLLLDVSTGSSASIALRNSNYKGVETSASTGTNFEYTAPGTNGNQTAAPLLADPTAGDFRELAGSPTVDAGTTAAGPLGSFDLTGAARSQPRCIGGAPVPDIGAYELTPTQPCSSAPLPAPEQAKLGFGKLKLNRAKGTATLAVKVQVAGKLSLNGKGLVPRKARTPGKATVKLKIKAKGKKAKALLKSGKAKVRAKVKFTPESANELPASKTRTIILKLQPQAARNK